jgi:short-subunit dehydrogenase
MEESFHENNLQKKAIIIGASSGIGRSLAEVLAENGYITGLTARRKQLLLDLQSSIKQLSFVKEIDISDPETAIRRLNELIEEMGGADLIIVNAGVGFLNPDLEWKKERDTITVNVTGFCAVATFSMRYFMHKKRGHLVGISSVSALRGLAEAPAYGASKAFMSHYLDALRHLVFKKKLPIVITDIQPGFVKTEMEKKSPYRFWEATSREAAEQIYEAIDKKKPHAYITRRWRLIAWLMKLAPDWIYFRF